MKNSITISASIFINRKPGMVWDFTQDYHQRTKWDKAVRSIKIIEETPNRIVELKLKGKQKLRFQYKLDDRPTKTRLAIIASDSWLLAGGGGSWNYEPKNGGTEWSQTNALILKSGIMVGLLKPVIRIFFQRQMRSSMRMAKAWLEKE
ncbi:MAG: hypothetical protein ACI9NN_000019 [Bacteroidia bacterium]|jgi:hypothetical protein